ncbi:hypothetical protein [Micromonospora parathelypteridis]|uniref:Uncharacterized protein n=1 Tax=Micromonospora parathelypteridis TaxID=1839617 RepID=A0A840VFQ4_9ACTN|nr:hypothetical protein [Micromonospora parathelypteridis]MBB5475603.1 hypothetical protein [Micromonospora parathelypteridis]GGO27437.1 hypothetical protein GCM10011576_52140 [Micromonospora parathelypteridis]
MGWIAVVGTLAGTVIGMIGTIAGQRVAASAAESRERLQRRAALRGERKIAVDAFLEAAQETEVAAANRKSLSDKEKDHVAKQLWSRHKQLTLICSDELSTAADNLANELGHCLWQGAPDGQRVYEAIGEQTRLFRQAAKAELTWSEQ